MEKLKYKEFTWPNNPSVYREKRIREPQYIKDADGNFLYSGLGPEKVTIEGEGAFFGASAAADYKKLEALMADVNYGALIHPELGTRYGYLTGLEMTQEPRQNYVSYRFTFTGMQVGGDIPR